MFLPVSEEEQLDHPDSQQHHAIDLCHCECPFDPVNIVKKLIRKGRAAFFGRDSLVDDRDDDCGQDQVKASIKDGYYCLPPLHGQTVDLGIRHRNLHVVIMPPYAFPKTPLCLIFSRCVDRTDFTVARCRTTLHSQVQSIRGRVSRPHKLLWRHGCLLCPSTGTAAVGWGFLNCRERKQKVGYSLGRKSTNTLFSIERWNVK